MLLTPAGSSFWGTGEATRPERRNASRNRSQASAGRKERACGVDLRLWHGQAERRSQDACTNAEHRVKAVSRHTVLWCASREERMSLHWFAHILTAFIAQNCAYAAATCTGHADCIAYACCTNDYTPDEYCPPKPDDPVSGNCEDSHEQGAYIYNEAAYWCYGTWPTWY